METEDQGRFLTEAEWRAPHVQLAYDGNGMGRFRCTHCGEVFRYSLPVKIDFWIAMSRAYGRAHRHCPKPLAPKGGDARVTGGETEEPHASTER